MDVVTCSHVQNNSIEFLVYVKMDISYPMLVLL